MRMEETREVSVLLFEAATLLDFDCNSFRLFTWNNNHVVIIPIKFLKLFNF